MTSQAVAGSHWSHQTATRGDPYQRDTLKDHLTSVLRIPGEARKLISTACEIRGYLTMCSCSWIERDRAATQGMGRPAANTRPNVLRSTRFLCLS